MQGLIGLYLVTSGIQYFPLVVIIWSLKYGLPSALFLKSPGYGLSFSHGLRSVGIARFEQLFQLFDSDIKDYSVTFSLITCVCQILGIFIIMLAIALDEPLPFIPDLEGVSYMGLMYELFLFAAATNFIHLLPTMGLILALLYRIPLPFAAELKKNRAQERNEITRWEEDSEGFAWIRLTRFENSEKTFIYANCRDERWGKVFKLVLCQGKKGGDRPQCFLYSEDESTLEQINPAPASVKELDEIFIPDDNEATAYSANESTFEQINPAPDNVTDPDEIFILNDDEATVYSEDGSTLVQIHPAPVDVTEPDEIVILGDEATASSANESTLEHINPNLGNVNEIDEIVVLGDEATGYSEDGSTLVQIHPAPVNVTDPNEIVILGDDEATGYSEDGSTLVQIHPAPVNVNKPDEIFILGDDEPTVYSDDKSTLEQISLAPVDVIELDEIVILGDK